MVDEEIIYKHLKELNSIIEELKDLQKYTLDEISSERKKQWEVEHGLQLVRVIYSSHHAAFTSKGILDSTSATLQSSTYNIPDLIQ